jgi:hypothetical protein
MTFSIEPFVDSTFIGVIGMAKTNGSIENFATISGREHSLIRFQRPIFNEPQRLSITNLENVSVGKPQFKQ